MSDTPVFIMNDGRYVKEEHFDRVEKQLAEALADADHWKSECNALQRIAHEARAEIESKNKLIEQMREALGDAFDHICPDGDPLDARELEVCNKIEAAQAAEGCE